MDRNQKICYGFIIIYICLTIYFMISFFLIINGLPIDDFIIFFNKINENLDIESISNIILRINDNFNSFYNTAQKINNVTDSIIYFKDKAETINTQLDNYNNTIYYLTDNVDYFKNTAESINTQLNNYNDTIFFITDNMENFHKYSNNMNETIFEIRNTIKYFRNTAEDINKKMLYLDNFNMTIHYLYKNINNFNNTIISINDRLTNIEDNIELILYNTNQDTIPPTTEDNNIIN